MTAKPDLKNIPEFTVVIPARNEGENIGPLINEINAVFSERQFEIIIINDCSNDGTANALAEARRHHKKLKIITHNNVKGQSTAIVSGVQAAKAEIIITMDGDGQNDPTDALKLIDRYLSSHGNDQVMVVGHRVNRRDTWLKRISSKAANTIRSGLLSDATPDTGCGLKVFSRDVFLQMPIFNHMHRFLPALMIRAGGLVLSVPVNDRPRTHGASKYGFWDRLWYCVCYSVARGFLD